MTTIYISVTEHDGLNTRNFVLPLIVDESKLKPEKDAVRQAVKDACNEYIRTTEGKRTYEYNCHCFNWADFEAEVPNTICSKYGFTKGDSNAGFDADWDEHLIDDPENEE